MIDWAEGGGRVTQALLDHAVALAGCQIIEAAERYSGLAGTERDIKSLVEFYPEHLQVFKVQRSPAKTLVKLETCPRVGRKPEGIVQRRTGSVWLPNVLSRR